MMVAAGYTFERAIWIVYCFGLFVYLGFEALAVRFTPPHRKLKSRLLILYLIGGIFCFQVARTPDISSVYGLQDFFVQTFLQDNVTGLMIHTACLFFYNMLRATYMQSKKKIHPGWQIALLLATGLNHSIIVGCDIALLAMESQGNDYLNSHLHTVSILLALRNITFAVALSVCLVIFWTAFTRLKRNVQSALSGHQSLQAHQRTSSQGSGKDETAGSVTNSAGTTNRQPANNNTMNAQIANSNMNAFRVNNEMTIHTYTQPTTTSMGTVLVAPPNSMTTANPTPTVTTLSTTTATTSVLVTPFGVTHSTERSDVTTGSNTMSQTSTPGQGRKPEDDVNNRHLLTPAHSSRHHTESTQTQTQTQTQTHTHTLSDPSQAVSASSVYTSHTQLDVEKHTLITKGDSSEALNPHSASSEENNPPPPPPPPPTQTPATPALLITPADPAASSFSSSSSSSAPTTTTTTAAATAAARNEEDASILPGYIEANDPPAAPSASPSARAGRVARSSNKYKLLENKSSVENSAESSNPLQLSPQPSDGSKRTSRRATRENMGSVAPSGEKSAHVAAEGGTAPLSIRTGTNTHLPSIKPSSPTNTTTLASPVASAADQRIREMKRLMLRLHILTVLITFFAVFISIFDVLSSTKPLLEYNYTLDEIIHPADPQSYNPKNSLRAYGHLISTCIICYFAHNKYYFRKKFREDFLASIGISTPSPFLLILQRGTDLGRGGTNIQR